MENLHSLLEDRVKVLLVEDSPSDAELIKLTLSSEMEKLEFRRVDTDPDLRQSLIEYDPQVIISDYSMPGFSGLEALSICRTMKPGVPFVFVSGTIGEERAVEALKNGANDYVLKDSLSRLPHAIQQTLVMQRDKRVKKRQQEELARTYELLHSIFDTTHMMVAYMDTDFNFIQVNRSFTEAFGQEAQYYPGKNFFKLLDAEVHREKLLSVVNTGKPYFEFLDTSLSAPSDPAQKLYFDWSVAPTKSYGMVEGLVFTSVDMTDRVKLRQETMQSRQRFKDALNQAPDAILIVNDQGKIAFVSQEAEAYFGYGYKELLNQPIEMLIPSRFAYGHPQKRKKYAAKPKRRSTGAVTDLFAKRKDGSKFPVDINLGPLDWEGSTGTMVVIRDITHKREQEKELRKLSMVASHVSNAVFITDGDFKISWVNKAFVDQMGYTLKDVEGKTTYEVFANQENDKTIRAMGKDLLAGTSLNKEMTVMRKGGEIYWGGMHVTPVLNDKGVLEQAIYIVSDISQRKEAELERDVLLKTLEDRVAERTAELSSANERLSAFNKDMMDSISYARIIQNAFVPTRTANDFHVSDAFVVDMPRDVLSGDFHWSYHNPVGNCTFIVLADCTGHGVPASLMTLLGVQMLEQSLVGYHAKRSTSMVLSEVNNAIVQFLGQERSTTMMNDGMEIALFRIDHEEGRVMYSSAGRPVYRCRKGELKRLKSTKVAVGGVVKGVKKEFEEFEYQYDPSDRLYVFSDGFVDQFGGEKGRKFMRCRLEKLLVKMQDRPFGQHAEILQSEFNSWKGDLAQVDDVIVLGLEL